jgi:alkenylglycerophosphocholine/alkenylglycerophosphoethanolamine hydrolase
MSARHRALALSAIVSALAGLYALVAMAGLHAATVVCKPLPILAMALAVSFARRPLRRSEIALAMGLGFSMVGDVALALRGDHFVQGLGAFLLAHLAYLVAFTRADDAGRVTFRPLRALPYLALSAVVFSIIAPGLGAMVVPVAIYLIVLVAMGIASAMRIGHPTESTATGWARAIGAALFVASDATIAIDRFRAPFAAASAVIMATYYAGQLGITLGAVLAAPRALAASPIDERAARVR